MRQPKKLPLRPMTLVVTVEDGQPVRTRVRFDREQDESRAYALSVEAARLAEPLRKLMGSREARVA
jgi:hypothetical protein